MKTYMPHQSHTISSAWRTWFISLMAVATPISAQAPAAISTAKTMIVTPAEKVKFESLRPGLARALVLGDLARPIPTAFFLRMEPAVGRAHTHSHEYYGHVIAGRFTHFAPDQIDRPMLGPGATWFQPGGEVHVDSCEGPQPCTVYVLFPHGFDVQFPQPRSPDRHLDRE